MSTLRGGQGVGFPWGPFGVVKPFTSGCLLWDSFFLGRFEQLIVFRGTKNIIIILDWRCLSKGSDETVDHLCLHCSVRESQFLFFNCLLMPKSFVALLGCWLGGFGGHHNIVMLGSICGGRGMEWPFQDYESHILRSSPFWFHTLVDASFAVSWSSIEDFLVSVDFIS